jgi:pyruvate,water dikinase
MIDLSKSRIPLQAGEKARHLGWLIRQGYRVPAAFVLPFSYYEEHLQNPEAAEDKARSLLQGVIEPGSFYAVRSSANLEDTQQLSFAGQFRTVLNVSSLEEILQAVQEVWAAAGSESVHLYAQRSGQSTASLQMAVIIQKMVTPLISGVAFSRNPLTGLNEIVIEAIPGSGEQLVQDGKTPQRWVYRWGDWTVKPDSSSISLDMLRQVAQETGQIAKKYGAPVDLEWVYDGEALHWVQLRPITRLDGINIYSNRISREVFPGLIKPLIWSVNVPLVNTVWITLFSEMTGPNELQPDDLAKSFGYRAYFNMGTIGRIFELMGFPRESLEILLGLPGGSEKPRFKPSPKTMSLLPRLIGFGLGKLNIGPDVLPALAEIRTAYDEILKTPVSGLDDRELLKHIDRLYPITQKVAYYNVVVPLLMSVYNAFLGWQLTRLGVDYARFDLTYGLRELEEYNPNMHIRQAAHTFQAFADGVQAQIASATYQVFTALPGIAGFQTQVANIITRFGHLSDSGNDFSSVPWRETPELVLQMVTAEAQRLRTHAGGEAVQVKTHFNFQQPERAAQPAEKTTWQSISLSPLRRRLLQPIYDRARRFRLYREAVSSAYTYGYGLFRVYFLELGRRFVGHGILAEPQDIFYLRWEEVRQVAAGELEGSAAGQRAAARKAELEISRSLNLPETIYGNELPPLLDLSQSGSDVYSGIPSSRGYYRGPVKVIRSLADFGKLEPGDVLVIPFSDVSWTPLFTRAGAVIAESGGILSHSSIVAREFNLPCVVSVSHACQIPDNTLVAVDGFKGEVIVQGAL